MNRRSDFFEFSVHGSVTPDRTFVAGTHFRADLFALSESLSLPLAPLELDLARIGVSSYVADRLCRRPRLTGGRYPARTMELTIPVSDPDFWRHYTPEVIEPLRYLGDDEVDVHFVQAPPSRSLCWTLPLFPSDLNAVALYSTGLDSAAGLVTRLADTKNHYLTITAEHQPHQRRRINHQWRAIPRDLSGRASFTLTRTTLLDPPRLGRQERTQRLRAFLFCALAGAAAAQTHVDLIEVFENGCGAVNVPPMEGMYWGGLATRGSHPHFLRLMGRLVSRVAGRPVRFELPFKWCTKGEIVRRAIAAGGENLLRTTVSCVHYPLHELGPAKQCGLCPGCIGHLQAMHAANSSVTRPTFKHDPLKINSLAGHEHRYVRAFLAQLHDLRHVRAGCRLEGFRSFLETSGAITSTDTWEQWLALHLRYLAECENWLERQLEVEHVTEPSVVKGDAAVATLTETEDRMATLRNTDPKVFGERLTKYRKAVDKTQEQIAEALGLSRPTYIAIEKGNRAASPEEIIKLAEIVNRPVHELVRSDPPVRIEPHLRVGIDASSKDADEVVKGIQGLEQYAEDYLKLERMLSVPLTTNYPPEIELPSRGNLSDFAEEVADRERARLQLGDQPIPNLRAILESEVGVRIFFGPLPSRVAGLYAFVTDLGCCMMINSKHPGERQRTSLAHEYGHVLVDRYKPGVDYFIHDGRKPANERFVEAFAMAFLMPAHGVRRHFREVYNSTGDFQVGDLVRLGSQFAVSIQSMTYRLEGLGLLTRGTWDMLSSAKFKVQQAKQELQLVDKGEFGEPALPERYTLLAVHAYVRGLIGEGELAKYLRCDRIAAREIVAERAQHLEVASDGTTELFNLPFAESLVTQK